jgi:hypothetical protein
MTRGRFAPWLAVSLLAAFPAAALAHDPRTTARKLSQGLEIEGVGRLDLDYRGMHFNAQNFERARTDAGYLSLLNRQVWGRMGHAKLGFALVAGGLTLPPGDYDFGINMDLAPTESFSVVLWQGETKHELPLVVEHSREPVPYLSIALQVTAAPDVFLLEARCGPYRGTVELKVPAVDAEHEHAHPAP